MARTVPDIVVPAVPFCPIVVFLAATKSAGSRFAWPNIGTSKHQGTERNDENNNFVLNYHGQNHADNGQANVQCVGVEEGTKWLETAGNIDVLQKFKIIIKTKLKSN